MKNTSVVQAAMTAQRRSAESGAGRGYDEQWQRALEKAHLEKQAAAMRSTVSSDAGTALARRMLSSQPKHPPMQLNEPVKGERELTQDMSSQRPENQTFQTSSSGVRFQAAPAPAVLRPTVAMCLPSATSPTSQGSAGSNAISPSRKVPISLQFILPPSSSVKALVSEQGVHVIIRNASLENIGVLRLLNKISEVLAENDLPLAAVTLNGYRIWEKQDLTSGFSEDINSDQKIDLLY